MRELEGLTVAEALALCRADFADARMIDEPPGKLRAIEIACAGKSGTTRLVLEFEYDPNLFSATRSWPRSLIISQKIISVHTSSEGDY
jgi:hypothetical protein